jgi:hypothetical protein
MYVTVVCFGIDFVLERRKQDGLITVLVRVM